jgi:predicted phage terminase large subunit-like protein
MQTGRVPHPQDWAPNPQQELFLQLSCFEGLFGGAAGGGKSDCALADLVSYVGQGYGGAYHALALRRTFPELQLSLIRRAHELYPRFGGRWFEGKLQWRFPAGEVIQFGHLEHEQDVHRYQGAAFTRVVFDELTTFSEHQYLYLFSRIRSAEGVPCGVRATSNPGGIGHAWVRKRWLPWVSRKATRQALPGEVRYYVRGGDGEREERTVPMDPAALGRTFIPSRLSDNAHISLRDPSYAARLRALPTLERARLEGGDWDAEPAARDYWDASRLQRVAVRPRNIEVVARCRAWDFGSTTKGDPTAGVLVALLASGLPCIEHVVHLQGPPNVVRKTFEDTARADLERDPRTVQCIPQDPGQAGVDQVASYQAAYPWCPIRARRPTGDKVTRFMNVSSRELAGNVVMVCNDSWDHDGFNAEAEAFPAGVHDDRVDATSDAYAEVAQPDTSGEVQGEGWMDR